MENFIVLNIGDHDYGFKFTMHAIDLICEKGGFDYHELIDRASSRPFAIMGLILRCSYENYHRGEKTLDVYQADDLIELMEPDQLQQFWDSFEKSFLRLAEKMKALREGAKKK